MDYSLWLDGPATVIIFCVGGFGLALFSALIRTAAPVYKGLIRVSLGTAFIALGYLPILLFSLDKPLLGVVIGNTLVVLGISMVGNGIWAYMDMPKQYEPLAYLPPLIVLPVLWYFQFVYPSMLAVNAVVSLLIMIQFSASGWVLLNNYPFRKKNVARSIAAVFFLLALLFLFRLILLFDPASEQFGIVGASPLILLIGLTLGGIAWTFGLLLMTANRLAEELAYGEINANRRTTDLLVRAIIDSIPHPIVLKDRNSRYLLVNKAYALLLGKDLVGLAGTYGRDHYSVETAELFRSYDIKTIDEESMQSFYGSVIINGKELTMDVVWVPVWDDKHTITGVLSIFRDVSEQLTARKALEESEQRYRELSAELEQRVEMRTLELADAKRDIELFFEVSVDYLGIIDYEGQVLKMSSAWYKEMGWREDELIGSVLQSFVHHDEMDRLSGAMRFILSGIPLRDFHIRFRKADGTWVWLSISAVGVSDRKLVILAAHDITVQVEIEERLRLARQEAERASRAKSQFIATMSHELRTPLNAVLGYSALLEQIVVDEQGKAYLRSIGTAGRSLLAIINDILDLTRAESGRIELIPLPFEPRKLMEELADIFRFQAEEKGLELNLKISSTVPRTVMLDQARLRQVMVNLTGNAIKFTEEGSVTVSVDAVPEKGYDTKDERNSYKVVLKAEVQDTGIGIADDYRNRLFDSFSQQDPSIAQRFGGAGLGLSIAKKLLDLMGGTIRCDSVEEGGTRFRIEIPKVSSAGISDCMDLSIGNSKKTRPVTLPKSRDFILKTKTSEVGNKILLLSNTAETLDSLADLIEKAGLDAVKGNCRKDAFKYYDLVDAVIIDAASKSCDGIELCKALKKIETDDAIPVLIITDKKDRKSLIEALRAGAADYLTVPFDREELQLRLTNQLELKRTRSTVREVNKELFAASVAIEEKEAKLENLTIKLDRASSMDSLTGLANRASIHKQILRETERSIADIIPLSLIVADVDRLKQINDRYGHQAGDTLLSECAKRFAESLRDEDFVGRWGGEEFLAVLPDTDLQSARNIAERIRSRVGDAPIIYGTDSIRMTISLGVTSLVPYPNSNPEEISDLLIRAADDALFRSKARGRNHVEALEAYIPDDK